MLEPKMRLKLTMRIGSYSVLRYFQRDLDNSPGASKRQGGMGMFRRNPKTSGA